MNRLYYRLIIFIAIHSFKMREWLLKPTKYNNDLMFIFITLQLIKPLTWLLKFCIDEAGKYQKL